MVLLLTGLSKALKYDFHDPDTPIRLVGLFLLPAIAMFVGLALKRGKPVAHGSVPGVGPESENN